MNPADPLTVAIRQAVRDELTTLRDDLLDTVAARAVPQYLDAAGVCKMLQICRPTLNKLIESGLPCCRFGEVRRFDPDLVRQWVNREVHS